MPEGDTIHRAAKRLAPALVGELIVDLSGSHRAVGQHRSRLIGRRIDEVAAHGKHLLIHLERGWTIRTHMGMPGRWSLYAPGEPWRTTPGKARVVIETAHAVAVCFAAPYVEIGPTERVLERLSRIGPDLIGDNVPFAAIARIASTHPGPTAADLLLDQSVASGIGNVFKSEVLFLEGISPHTAPEDLDAQQLEAVYRRAARLLSANVSSGARSTTTDRRPGEHYWVYGRAGRPCRRCGTAIDMDRHGHLDRSSYWCPTCQPVEPPASERSALKG